MLNADGVFRVALALDVRGEIAIFTDAERRAAGPDFVGLSDVVAVGRQRRATGAGIAGRVDLAIETR